MRRRRSNSRLARVPSSTATGWWRPTTLRVRCSASLGCGSWWPSMGLCPGPSLCWRLLLKLELNRVVCTIRQLHVQLPASSGPGSVRLPSVDVMACCRVVLEPAGGDGSRLLYRLNRQPRVAGDLLGSRVAGSEDV